MTDNSSRRFVRLQADDNVVVSTSAIAANTRLDEGITSPERLIPPGHKIAWTAIASGERIVKFGQTIGYATEDIAPGQHVHVHNCAMGAHDSDYQIGDMVPELDAVDEADIETFDGYARAGGRPGTRNFIAICSTVNCSASVVRAIADQVNGSGILDGYPHVDGVIALSHGTGCGMAASGYGFDNLERVLWGYATHPNVGAALFIGLGCEVMQIARLKEIHGFTDGGRFHTLTIQSAGGTRKTIEAGVDYVKSMLPAVNDVRREPFAVSHLAVALQCGGSDGFSGITANPALGHAADLLARRGGTGILAETPEIYGAEQLLVRRAVSREVGERLIERVRWWEDYTGRNGGEMDNNPSPGNKAGGLTTILEKSLGAAAKGGTTALTDVIHYGAPANVPGFVFMDSPGYDPASVTGQIASGAQIVCFTTGRGSAFGSKPSPTIKLATNSAMYRTMAEDMDINCGDIIEEGVSIEDKGLEIFRRIVAVASGARTKSEQLGLGDNEFVPWQIGAVM